MKKLKLIEELLTGGAESFWKVSITVKNLWFKFWLCFFPYRKRIIKLAIKGSNTLTFYLAQNESLGKFESIGSCDIKCVYVLQCRGKKIAKISNTVFRWTLVFFSWKKDPGRGLCSTCWSSSIDLSFWILHMMVIGHWIHYCPVGNQKKCHAGSSSIWLNPSWGCFAIIILWSVNKLP